MLPLPPELQSTIPDHERRSLGGTRSLFGDYPLDSAFDEMREGNGDLRPHYRALAETLPQLPHDELQRRKQSADLSFLTQGITFTVYGRDEGTERIFPYDLLPRLITSAEWERIERGLTQRITALNHLPARHLLRRQNPQRPGHPPRAGLQLQAVPPPDARPAGAPQRLHRGHRQRTCCA